MYNGLIIYQEVYNFLHLNHECGELYQKSIVLKKVFESRLHSILHCKKTTTGEYACYWNRYFKSTAFHWFVVQIHIHARS